VPRNNNVMAVKIWKGDFTAVKTAQDFQIRPIRVREHLVFNLLNFLYFRKNDCKNCFLIESHPLGLFIIIPYVMFSEAYFFRRKKYFIILKQQKVGTLALQEKADTLYIINLAASPFYRKIGVATHILNFSAAVAKRLHKNSLELSVLKANTPALILYMKAGFIKKKERGRSFILTKNVQGN